MNRLNLFIISLVLICGVTMFSPTELFAKETNKFVLVLDAGHGGGDIGTPHRKCKKDEKTIALDVALRVGKLIEKNHSDVKVVYTRKKDTYPTLPERTQIAKKAQGDLFISIHVNAAPDPSAHGIETYVFGVTGLKGKSADEQKRIRERMANEIENLDIDGKLVDFDKDMDIETKILCQAQREKNNIYSEEVAKYVHNAILYAARRTSYKANVKDRSIKQKNIFVLCYSPMPSVLVELGYMSNPKEEKFITSEEGLAAFSSAIYDGFVKYKKSWSKRKLSNNDDINI
ncbi:MAG: N-acetylmuramoyl-L-alanine amidase, partial [Bacteroidales bacterium]|nr:N-acetylmuramoyl-L-alanine amidase [Bacteroidales bacterium]